MVKENKLISNVCLINTIIKQCKLDNADKYVNLVKKSIYEG